MKCQFLLLVGKFQEAGHTLLLIGLGAALGLMGRLAFLLHLSPHLRRFPLWFPSALVLRGKQRGWWESWITHLTPRKVSE